MNKFKEQRAELDAQVPQPPRRLAIAQIDPAGDAPRVIPAENAGDNHGTEAAESSSVAPASVPKTPPSFEVVSTEPNVTSASPAAETSTSPDDNAEAGEPSGPEGGELAVFFDVLSKQPTPHDNVESFSQRVYAIRKQQLKVESTITGLTQQEIVEAALSDYFQKKYGQKRRKPKP